MKQNPLQTRLIASQAQMLQWQQALLDAYAKRNRELVVLQDSQAHKIAELEREIKKLKADAKFAEDHWWINGIWMLTAAPFKRKDP